MPVEKFRSIEEMNAAPIRATAEDAFDRFLRHCVRYFAVHPRISRRGVLRFGSLQEAQAARRRISETM